MVAHDQFDVNELPGGTSDPPLFAAGVFDANGAAPNPNPATTATATDTATATATANTDNRQADVEADTDDGTLKSIVQSIVTALSQGRVAERQFARLTATQQTLLAQASADKGVSAAGLITIVQPAASAGEAFRVIIALGKFHGVIAVTTPTGCFTVSNRRSFDVVGITSP